MLKCSAYVFFQKFLVSGLTFRPLIHFEYIFVYGMRKCSNFTLLHVAVQFSQHHLLKGLSFLHCIFLPPLLQSDHKCVGLFWALYSVPLIYVSAFVSVPCYFDYHSFVVQSEVRECDTSSFVLFFLKIALAIQGPLWFHINFRIICLNSVQNFMAILKGIALNLQIALGNIAILIILISAIFPFLCIVFNFLHQCFMVFIVQVFHFQNKNAHSPNFYLTQYQKSQSQ